MSKKSIRPKQEKDNIVNKLLEIATHAVLGEPQERVAVSYREPDGKNTLSLTTQGYGMYEALADELARSQNLGGKFSGEYFITKIYPILRAAKTGGKLEAKNNVGAFYSDLLNYDVEQAVIVPLTGLSVRTESLVLGEVRFFSASLESLRKWASEYFRINSFMGNRQVTVEDVAFFDRIVEKTCALYRCTAERERAFERAREATTRSLEALTFVSALIHDGLPTPTWSFILKARRSAVITPLSPAT